MFHCKYCDCEHADSVEPYLIDCADNKIKDLQSQLAASQERLKELEEELLKRDYHKQRMDFAYGNTVIDNPNITKEMVAVADANQRLSFLEGLLEEIKNHPHITEMYQCGTLGMLTSNDYRAGIAEGHRCAAVIAARKDSHGKGE